MSPARPAPRWLGTLGAALAAWLLAPTAAHLAVACWGAGGEGAHGPLVVGIALWLLWRRRHELLAARSAPRPLLGLAVAIPALWILLAARLERGLSVEVPCAVLASGGLLVARRGTAPLRVGAFPLAFVLLAPPMPVPLAGDLLVELKLSAASIAARLLDLAGTPVVQVGSTLHLPGATLEVDEACSGLRGLTSIVAVAALYGHFSERPAQQVAALLLAVPVAVAANVLRIVTLCALASSGRPAGDVLHAALGLGVYLVALGALALVARVIPGSSAQPRPPARRVRAESATPWLAVEVAALALLVVADATTRVDRGPRVPRRPLPLPTQVGAWSAEPLPLSPRVPVILGTDDVQALRFARPGEPTAPVDVVVVRAWGDPWRAFHPPDGCFLGAEFVIDDDADEVSSVAGAPVNRRVYRRGAERVLVYHWYEIDGVRVVDKSGFRVAAFARRLLTLQESDATLVRASVPLAHAGGEAVLREFLARAGQSLR